MYTKISFGDTQKISMQVNIIIPYYYSIIQSQNKHAGEYCYSICVIHTFKAMVTNKMKDFIVTSCIIIIIP